jgi:hypothetical protein
MKRDNKLIKYEFAWIAFLFLETLLLFLLVSFFATPGVIGGVGGNVTVITSLTVGNAFPEILNVSINLGNTTLVLSANSTVIAECIAIIRDFNNESDLNYVYGDFYDMNRSNLSGTDDNNWHYSDDNCDINRTFGSWNGYNDPDNYTALANCSFTVYYYAFPGNWNCTVVVNDSSNWNASSSDNITIAELLAFELPATINYGTVNATAVSSQNTTEVKNAGNVKINLSLYGYATAVGDNLSMNCTLGAIKNISIEHEKYNLTNSNTSGMTLSESRLYYLNLTSSPIVRQFDLNLRLNDTDNEANKSTYWRMYVPMGVGGTCQGKIVFGATKAAGT